MSVKINFDTSGQPEPITLVLTKRNGDKIGVIPAVDIVSRLSLQNADEMTFKVKKEYNGIKNVIWDNIVDFKLIWCVEYRMFYQITVEINEDDEDTKLVSATRLPQAELSQILLFNYEINTEEDIARDDYTSPTVFYNKDDTKNSLLNRLLEKAPHYQIKGVDSTLLNIQRSFSFDNISIYDAFTQIQDEIGCLFLYTAEAVGTDNLNRGIQVVDMMSNCHDCGYRGDFEKICPKCGGTTIFSGYGNDTGVFITSDMLANELNIKADTDSVKNCLRLVAGDDLMTATIKNCNPNGSSYIWNITEFTKKDMSPDLVEKIELYDSQYKFYMDSQKYYFRELQLNNYNSVVQKYNSFKDKFSNVQSPVIGYNAVMNVEYDCIDLQLFIQSELMPDTSLDDTSAEKQIELLTSENIGTISIANISSFSKTTADTAILDYLKCIIDNRYSTDIESSSVSLDKKEWTGVLVVTNNSDEEDTAKTNEITIPFNDDYKNYVQQKVDKVFAKKKVDNVSISGIFKLSLDEFKKEMKKYGIDMLKIFNDACQAGIDVLTEQGVGTKETWAGENPNLYDDLYIPYFNKLKAVENELAVKESDLNKVTSFKNTVDNIVARVHDQLDFEKFLGNDLWLQFCAYRREDTYQNDNYISDGLSNRELFEKAREFFEVAEKEISKSAELQYSISASLNNLLVIDKFKPILKDFSIGNWIRVQVDEKVYKLRLLEYEIQYGDISTLDVEFSNVLYSSYGMSDQQSIISAMKSMATSYDYVQRQASSGEKSNKIVNDWKENGLDATVTQIIGGSDNQNQTWDSHGILLRKYDSIEDKYEDNQMKIVNSTIAITNDNWETVKTAIGYYFYVDNNGELKSAYGINAETIVGKLVLGNELYFSNENNTMTFDQNGLIISNGTNTFIVNPEDVNLLKIKKGEEDVFYVDQDGKLHITGDGTYIDVSENEVIEGIKTDILSVQKTAHSHENKEILDDIEAAYKIVEQKKLAEITSITNLELEELLK